MQLSKDVIFIIEELKKHGFEAYAVGGCVRDFLMKREVKDWDITTNAKPEEIQKIFKNSVYENKFGTVGVLLNNIIYEVTTYRTEERYTDKRHPDVVKFTNDLKEDLSRRDFTINAMAFDGRRIIDLFEGQKDLERKIIRCVGDPDQRFSEDALRMLRAIRFACELDFSIEPKTFEAIKKNSGLIIFISKERIRDELLKILATEKPAKGMILMKEANLLFRIIPELEKGEKVDQWGHHIYPVFEHLIKSLEFCPSKDPLVRLATFLHDIGKPDVREECEDKVTFYGHDKESAKQTEQIMRRLRFSKKDIKRVTNLVLNHMFFYSSEVSDAGVRRFIRRVGKENIKDLIDVRIGDRLGSGCPKGFTRKLKELLERVEKVSQDPFSIKHLAVNGYDVMRILNIPPGPKVGEVLNHLLKLVLEDPTLNTKEKLEREIEKFKTN